MTIHEHAMQSTHSSWHKTITSGLSLMNPAYLHELESDQQWLPGPAHIFNAFSLPKESLRYVLIGESPYPRPISANGYAFWDNAVDALWSTSGLSKPVNRATSLRNFIKMLLVADGLLTAENTSQAAIAALDKQSLIQTNNALFHRLLDNGFLLLNASLVLSKRNPSQDAKAWIPFIQAILNDIFISKPDTTLILFGRIAKHIQSLLPNHTINTLQTEHPYNLSFINNQDVIQFFQPLRLLSA